MKGAGEVWAYERQTPNLKIGLRVKEILRHEQTPYQELLVADTLEFGRVLFLDDCIMFTEKDEFFYHEMITHVPLCAHSDPRSVLIVGGGDGGTLREVLKHDTVERAVLCDIDERVTVATRDFFPTLATGLDDARAELRHEDAIPYVATQTDSFDVIIVDSTDPVGPAVGLFEAPFYRSLKDALRPGGMVVVQAESPLVFRDIVWKVMAGLRSVFPSAQSYLGPTPTYPGGLWAFGAGLLGEDLSVKRRPDLDTKYYTPEIHTASLVVPPFLESLVR